MRRGVRSASGKVREKGKKQLPKASSPTSREPACSARSRLRRFARRRFVPPPGQQWRSEELVQTVKTLAVGCLTAAQERARVRGLQRCPPSPSRTQARPGSPGAVGAARRHNSLPEPAFETLPGARSPTCFHDLPQRLLEPARLQDQPGPQIRPASGACAPCRPVREVYLHGALHNLPGTRVTVEPTPFPRGSPHLTTPPSQG